MLSQAGIDMVRVQKKGKEKAELGFKHSAYAEKTVHLAANLLQ